MLYLMSNIDELLMLHCGLTRENSGIHCAGATRSEQRDDFDARQPGAGP